MAGNKRILGAAFLLAVSSLFTLCDIWQDAVADPRETYPSLSEPDARKLQHHQRHSELPLDLGFDGLLIAGGAMLAKSGIKAGAQP